MRQQLEPRQGIVAVSHHAHDVSQPGVSAQIKRLERELGHEMLDRSGRRVRLTEAGAAVRGHVAVGTMAAGPTGLLTPTLAAFHEAHRGVDITLVEAPSAQLLAQLRDGALDLIAVGFASPPGRDVHIDVVHDDRLAAAGAALERRATMSLATLAEHDLICLPPGTGIRASLDEACAEARLHPRVALEASRPEVVADLAAPWTRRRGASRDVPPHPGRPAARARQPAGPPGSDRRRMASRRAALAGGAGPHQRVAAPAAMTQDDGARRAPGDVR